MINEFKNLELQCVGDYIVPRNLNGQLPQYLESLSENQGEFREALVFIVVTCIADLFSPSAAFPYPSFPHQYALFEDHLQDSPPSQEWLISMRLLATVRSLIKGYTSESVSFSARSQSCFPLPSLFWLTLLILIFYSPSILHRSHRSQHARNWNLYPRSFQFFSLHHQEI